MKRVLLPLCLLINLGCWSQQFSAKDLIDFTGFQLSKFDGYILKKDYKRDYNSSKESKTITSYFKPFTKKDSTYRQIHIETQGSKTGIYYYTTSKPETDLITRQINKLGFRRYPDKELEFFEKEDITIKSLQEKWDTSILYGFYFVKTELPKGKDLSYAEDLLIFESHEFIKYVFGSDNVIKDEFYFSESEKSTCSVLFPNTNREIIFLWKDEVKYRDPAFLLCGNNFKTNSSANFNKLLIQNVWRSKQGIYCGMPLHELHDLNQNKISFYNWNSDRAGMLTKENTGVINFDSISVILGCLNCNGTDGTNYTVNSNDAFINSKKIYVSSIIIIPNKDQAGTTYRK